MAIDVIDEGRKQKIFNPNREPHFIGNPDPPIGGNPQNGQVHKDSTGQWEFDSKQNLWVGKNGSENILNEFVSLDETVVTYGASKNKDHWMDPATDKISNGLEYFIKDLLYLELSGEFNYGSCIDFGLKNLAQVDFGQRSKIAEFWYKKDAGTTNGDYDFRTYRDGEKNNFAIGISYGGGLKYIYSNDGSQSFSISVAGVGYTRNWGGYSLPSNFFGIDTGASGGVGMGGGINLKVGAKW